METWVKIALGGYVAYLCVKLARRLAWRMRQDPVVAAPPPPTTPTNAVEGFLESIRARNKIPALAGLALSGDDLLAQSVTGVRRAGGSERATLDDRFHLGSDGKAITAFMVAMLIEEGKLRWETTLGEIFGSRLQNMDTTWKPVTVEQLLTHRSGAPADLKAGGLWAQLWKREGTPTQQRWQLVEGLLTRPITVIPGARFLYSNAGYALLGIIAEQVTGHVWEESLVEKLFVPLGITTAGFGAPGISNLHAEPWGHTPAGKPAEPGPLADNPPAIAPAGTVHMNLRDWAKFVAVVLRGHPANPNRDCRLLSTESFARLLRSPADRQKQYAGGWLVAQRSWAKGQRPDDTGLVLTHAGSNTMWYCVAWLAPEKDIAVLTACNQGGPLATQACDQAAVALLKHLGTL